jgi:hypothetical protein
VSSWSFAIAMSLSFAPFQCRRDPDPELRREDTAGDALYALAERFDAEGDGAAAERTLCFLATRYPSNRFAAAARDRVERAGRTCTADVADGGSP